MKRRGFNAMLVAAAVLSLTACGKRDSLYLDHTRDEAKAPAHKPAKAAQPVSAQPALANTTDTNAPAETPAT